MAKAKITKSEKGHKSVKFFEFYEKLIRSYLHQAVLQICSQGCFNIQGANVGNGTKFNKTFTEFSQK